MAITGKLDAHAIRSLCPPFLIRFWFAANLPSSPFLSLPQSLLTIHFTCSQPKVHYLAILLCPCPWRSLHIKRIFIFVQIHLAEKNRVSLPAIDWLQFMSKRTEFVELPTNSIQSKQIFAKIRHFLETTLDLFQTVALISAWAKFYESFPKRRSNGGHCQWETLVRLSVNFQFTQRPHITVLSLARGLSGFKMSQFICKLIHSIVWFIPICNGCGQFHWAVVRGRVC